MIINLIYKEEQKKCFLFEGESLDENMDYVTIDVESHNVSNIYDFFQKKLIESLLKDEKDVIELSTNNIKGCQFFVEDSFVKLIDLIKKIIEQCNDTIDNCFKTMNDVEEIVDSTDC